MLYRRKKDWILGHIQGKKVLDLGCVQHDAENARDPDWLHGLIARQAQSVLGVDILEEDVSILKEKGYNIICADVEVMNLGDRFEVVVAGDIIEHLSNPGMFMERVFVHLVPGGAFLITTPNPVTFLRFLTVLFTGKVGANKEHICWFTPQVMKELARRSGFALLETAYVDDSLQYYTAYPKIWRLLVGINSLLCRLRPQIAETVCYRLKRIEETA